MEPLIFSPRVHRYSLALRRLPQDVESIGDVGGYESRASIVHKHFPRAKYTSINAGTAWYVGERLDVQCSGIDIPLPDNSLDAVISVDTLEHVKREDRPRVISEMCRISSEHVVAVVPFAGASAESEEATLLGLTRAGRIDDMPSLAEHLYFGLPTLVELQQYAQQFSLQIEPATPRRTYWAAQWAMAINQLALGADAMSVNLQLMEWQEAYLENCPTPSLSEAYRVVMWK